MSPALVYFLIQSETFFLIRGKTLSGVTGGNLVVDAGGREVLQNKTAVFGFFHNSRAKVFIAGDDNEVILVS
jgi:hypothetical protein